MELIDIVLRNQNQKDYKIYCMINDQDQPIGYICYGPTPMTEGTFDLYWIAVDPNVQYQGVGSKLLDFLEERVREAKGRMILADTSSEDPVYRARESMGKRLHRVVFNGKLRDEVLNGEIFTTLLEAQVLIENWRRDYNRIRPHSALGYRPPAPEAIMPNHGSTSLTLSVVQQLGTGHQKSTTNC